MLWRQYHVLLLKTPILTRKSLNLILSTCSIFKILGIYSWHNIFICLASVFFLSTHVHNINSCYQLRDDLCNSELSALKPGKSYAKANETVIHLQQMVLKKQFTTNRER